MAEVKDVKEVEEVEEVEEKSGAASGFRRTDSVSHGLKAGG